ncbi:MAG: chorismate synthase, partial [Eubacteriaceae bacterium]|nr:chorismate synthase [Eubacteriaceae bacterium]
MSSIWGNNIKFSIFGESHGNAIGGVIDNLPPGIELDMEFIESELRRRKPGEDSF